MQPSPGAAAEDGALLRLVAGFAGFRRRHFDADPDLYDHARLLEHRRDDRRFDHVPGWVAMAQGVREEINGPVTEADHALHARRAEQASVLASLGHLAAYRFVAEGVVVGRLHSHDWYFHFGWGTLQTARAPCGPFHRLDGGDPPHAALGSALPEEAGA